MSTRRLRFIFLFLLAGMALPSGASAGPASLLRDIQVGPGTSTHLDHAIELDGKLLFVADDAVHGRELWISDGTEHGTRLVRDIHPGTDGSFPLIEALNLVVWRGRAYFTASDGVHGDELWTTDGTEGGTRMVSDVRPGAASGAGTVFAALDALVLFGADDGVHGYELWASDGTEEGTRLVQDVTPGPEGSPLNAPSRFGSSLFFLSAPAIDGTPAGWWKTDGTEAGTLRLALVPGDFESAVEYQGALWFIGPNDGHQPCQLWKSDGTPAGTVHVADLEVFQASALTVAGETLYFRGFDVRIGAPPSPHAGSELWASDGTGAGTRLVKDIWPGALSSAVSNFTAVGDTLFFIAMDPEHGIELWKSDGTEAGTVVVKDIVPGRGQGVWGDLKNVQDILLFSAFDGVSAIGLWRSDGTEAGTHLVQTFVPHPNSPPASGPRAYLAFGNRVAFSVVEPPTGREPWAGRAALLTRQPARALQDLTDDVRALGLPAGIAQSLTAKLAAAEAALGRRGGTRAASRLLDAFEHEVGARTPVPISDAQAAELLEFAEGIEELLAVEEGGVLGRAGPERSRGGGPIHLDRVP
jgi:ELWxxDGT repeat protein